MCKIIGSIPLDVLKARMEAARLDKPEVIREIRKFGKLKKERARIAAREERRVLSGKFNKIHNAKEG